MGFCSSRMAQTKRHCRMALEDSGAMRAATEEQQEDTAGLVRDVQTAETGSAGAPADMRSADEEDAQPAKGAETPSVEGADVQPAEGAGAKPAEGDSQPEGAEQVTATATGHAAGAQWADDTAAVELPEDISEADCVSSDEEESGAVHAAAGDAEQGGSDAEQGGSDAEQGGSDAEQGGSDASSSESSADEGDAALSDVELEDAEDEDGESQGPVRSKNELVEEPLPELPADFVVGSDTPILEIGTIKSAFEQNVIVQATVSGEQRVLQEGSIFCLADRTVLGPVCEVFGKLSNPFYRVTFPKDAVEKFEQFKNQVGSQVYLVQPKAHWLDTFEIKQVRGTDASNGVDEELPEEEQEFSDDEAEAEFKRQKKLAKKRKSGNQEGKQRGRPSLEGRAGLPRMQPPPSLARAGDRAPSYKPRSARQQRPQPSAHSVAQDQRASALQPTRPAGPYAPIAAQPSPAAVGYPQAAFPQTAQPQMFHTSDPMAVANQWYHNAAMQQVYHPAMMPQQYNPQQYAPPQFPQQYSGSYLAPQQYQEQLVSQTPVGQYNQAQLLQQLLFQQQTQSQQHAQTQQHPQHPPGQQHQHGQQHPQGQQNQYPYSYPYQQNQPPH
ncbi:AaceriABR138Cp [[Ashbya] aceris (nom. inval.)]|nr:AaceriABR138Cp [[Ashbya] aceris (nom. inval.)]